MNTIKLSSLLALLFFSIFVRANDSELDRLLADRQKETEYLQLLNDSVIQGRLNKLYLTNLQMQKLIELDDILVLKAKSLSTDNKALGDSLLVEEKRAARFSLENIQLKQKAVSDAKMILILKASIAVLLLAILVLIYFIIIRKKPKEIIVERNEAELLQLRDENNAMKLKLDIYNQRDFSNREEIEKEIVKHTAVLQTQLDEANDKYRIILGKIEKLINDLSSVNQS